ncbi:MAG: branched-chain amino acid ABC transporter permease [Firmicutes bacterium]|nr:branched-chain amino acid ABC transporter permease [Bacillota bacterium]
MIADAVVLMSVYAILTLALNLSLGMAGLFNLGLAGFFAIGAYGTGLLAIAGWPFPAVLAADLVLGAAAGLLLAFPSLRLRGDYLAIVALGFGQLTETVLNSWDGLTGGANGLDNIPAPGAFAHVSGPVGAAVFALALLAVAVAVTEGLRRSPYGQLLGAVRDDEVLVQALGKSPHTAKVTALMLSGALSALGGAAYAYAISYVDPGLADFQTSVYVFLALLFGGMGSTWGSVVGGAGLVAVMEALQLVNLPTSVTGPAQEAFFALSLILLTLWRPQGVVAPAGAGRRAGAALPATAAEVAEDA